MKKIFAALAIATLLVTTMSCGGSRHTFGCPTNPQNYRAHP